MRIFKQIALSLLALGIAFAASAQTRQLKGKVVDTGGAAIPGVAVLPL